MPPPTKRQKHNARINAAKRQRRADQESNDNLQFDFEGAIGSEEEASEIGDIDEEIEETDGFKSMCDAAMAMEWSEAGPSYVRGPDITDRQKRRQRADAKGKMEEAGRNSQPITSFFKPVPGIQSSGQIEQHNDQMVSIYPHLHFCS